MLLRFITTKNVSFIKEINYYMEDIIGMFCFTVLAIIIIICNYTINK